MNNKNVMTEVFKLIYSGKQRWEEAPQVRVTAQNDATLSTGPMDVGDKLYVNPACVALLRSDIGKFNFEDIEHKEKFEKKNAAKRWRVVRWYRNVMNFFKNFGDMLVNLFVFGVGGSRYGYDNLMKEHERQRHQGKLACRVSVFGPQNPDLPQHESSLTRLTANLPSIAFRPLPGKGLNRIACVKLTKPGDRLCVCDPAAHFVCASAGASQIVSYSNDMTFSDRMPQYGFNKRLIDRGCLLISGPCLVFLYTRGDLYPVRVLPPPSASSKKQKKKNSDNSATATTTATPRLVNPADHTKVASISPEHVVAYDYGKIDFQWTATPHLRLVNLVASKNMARVFVSNE